MAVEERASSTLSNVSTFMGVPLSSVDDVRPGVVAVNGAPYSGVKFSREGSRGIRKASLTLADKLAVAGDEGFADVDNGLRLLPVDGALIDVGDWPVYPTDVLRTSDSIADGVYEITRRGGLSVCLGGDHYIEYPSCMGFCRAVEAKDPGIKVGYIHIDGHLDFGTAGEGPSRHNSGTNARLTSELNAISRPNMVWIGIQGPCDLESVREIRSMGGTIFTSDDIHSLGPAEVGRQAGEWASKGCDFVYMTLDIDVIDAGLSPGTGSVTMGAVPPLDLMLILEELSKFPIGALDVNEVTPTMDVAMRSPHYAVNALTHFLLLRLFRVERL